MTLHVCRALRVFLILKASTEARVKPSALKDLVIQSGEALFIPKRILGVPRSYSTFNMDGSKAIQFEHVKPATRNNHKSPHVIEAESTATISPANAHASLNTVNPVNIYREHIAENLAAITGVLASEISSSLQWTLTQDKGDLTLAVPALRIKGKKPSELATEWSEKVHSILHLNRSTLLT